eukprot:MONOS_15168.1-p1 / transcript=MONOS_15168.1 / gene=MONOS_15168 / organism=Monocercomonoides_exilis_PA203 / gene_product=unspecified product / transcript_product=unspecified product / location=Mono_scaffold01161:6387-7444(+) / protein_length=312 / sequence_SO=supercontig / SO=protein_coding / is_pseudo=false
MYLFLVFIHFAILQSPSMKQTFLEKLLQLEESTDAELKLKIEEMNKMIDEMEEEEIEDIFNKELFDKIHEMIEGEKLSMENTLLLLKHVGFSKTLRDIYDHHFRYSSLSKRIEKMIVDENTKKDGKNEKLLVDLCESYLLLSGKASSKLLLIYVPCLLKAALKKEENEEIQKEVEIALLALSNIKYTFLKQELFLDEVKEIILYHQECSNMTQLAYQSAWQFLIYRLWADNSLEEVIVNELHFLREATREPEKLMRCIDWKRKEGGEKEEKGVIIIRRWISLIGYFFISYQLRADGFVGLIRCVVQVFRAA